MQKPILFCAKVLPLILVSFLAYNLTGCATQKPPVLVDIPVAVNCPAPKIPPMPTLPISTLTAQSPPNEVIKKYALTVEVLENYSKQLRTLLQSYGK